MVASCSVNEFGAKHGAIPQIYSGPKIHQLVVELIEETEQNSSNSHKPSARKFPKIFKLKVE